MRPLVAAFHKVAYVIGEKAGMSKEALQPYAQKQPVDIGTLTPGAPLLGNGMVPSGNLKKIETADVPGDIEGVKTAQKTQQATDKGMPKEGRQLPSLALALICTGIRKQAALSTEASHLMEEIFGHVAEVVARKPDIKIDEMMRSIKNSFPKITQSKELDVRKVKGLVRDELTQYRPEPRITKEPEVISAEFKAASAPAVPSTAPELPKTTEPAAAAAAPAAPKADPYAPIPLAKDVPPVVPPTEPTPSAPVPKTPRKPRAKFTDPNPDSDESLLEKGTNVLWNNKGKIGAGAGTLAAGTYGTEKVLDYKAGQKAKADQVARANAKYGEGPKDQWDFKEDASTSDVDAQQQRKINLIYGVLGGAGLGAAGGIAYENMLSPQNKEEAPSIIGTTVAGAGLGGLTAMALNALQKRNKPQSYGDFQKEVKTNSNYKIK